VPCFFLNLDVRFNRPRVEPEQRAQTQTRLSTPALYGLCTAYGQSVDKKGLLNYLERYPQDHPQAQTLFYRGFRAYIPF